MRSQFSYLSIGVLFVIKYYLNLLTASWSSSLGRALILGHRVVQLHPCRSPHKCHIHSLWEPSSNLLMLCFPRLSALLASLSGLGLRGYVMLLWSCQRWQYHRNSSQRSQKCSCLSPVDPTTTLSTHGWQTHPSRRSWQAGHHRQSTSHK